MELLIAGNVQTILNGKVTKEALWPITLTKMPYALGGAAISKDAEPLSIGETVIFAGSGHIFVPQSPVEEQKTLNAAFMMGIRQKPRQYISVSSSQTIEHLYQGLVKAFPKGFAIVGKARFSLLAAAYLKISPIFGENINALHGKYWEAEEFHDREAQLFGVVLPKPDPRAFYDNPNESGNSALPSHTHVLAPLARHLLTHSELLSAELWIEEISEIATFTNDEL